MASKSARMRWSTNPHAAKGIPKQATDPWLRGAPQVVFQVIMASKSARMRWSGNPHAEVGILHVLNGPRPLTLTAYIYIETYIYIYIYVNRVSKCCID